ncbi:uncharacterized protein [Typha latifolia]|uniref:uncharacterized protein n=1 Tax=Typha latifolia TaxID=4733 RepID=UPI003C2F6CAE
MATLHKFKLLATQCTTAASPSRSPATAAAGSPVFRLRRRRTLRRLLSRRWIARGDPSNGKQTVDLEQEEEEEEEKKGLLASHTLRDLFISSPPGLAGGDRGGGDGGGGGRRRVLGLEEVMVVDRRGGGGGGGWRFGSGGLRFRLLRRSWRPVLLSIPE